MNTTAVVGDVGCKGFSIRDQVIVQQQQKHAAPLLGLGSSSISHACCLLLTDPKHCNRTPGMGMRRLPKFSSRTAELLILFCVHMQAFTRSVQVHSSDARPTKVCTDSSKCLKKMHYPGACADISISRVSATFTVEFVTLAVHGQPMSQTCQSSMTLSVWQHKSDAEVCLSDMKSECYYQSNAKARIRQQSMVVHVHECKSSQCHVAQAAQSSQKMSISCWDMHALDNGMECVQMSSTM